jgi:hypothetical protein
VNAAFFDEFLQRAISHPMKILALEKDFELAAVKDAFKIVLEMREQTCTRFVLLGVFDFTERALYRCVAKFLVHASMRVSKRRGIAADS